MYWPVRFCYVPHRGNVGGNVNIIGLIMTRNSALTYLINVVEMSPTRMSDSPCSASMNPFNCSQDFQQNGTS